MSLEEEIKKLPPEKRARYEKKMADYEASQKALRAQMGSLREYERQVVGAKEGQEVFSGEVFDKIATFHTRDAAEKARQDAKKKHPRHMVLLKWNSDETEFYVFMSAKPWDRPFPVWY